MDSYVAWNESCFKVTWTIFKTHLLEVGLLQHRKTMALQNLTAVHLLYYIMCEDPTFIKKIHWSSIWLKAWSHMTSHYTWGHVTTLYDFGSVLGQPLNTSLGLSQFHGHSSWLMCEVALSMLDQRLSMSLIAHALRNLNFCKFTLLGNMVMEPTTHLTRVIISTQSN